MQCPIYARGILYGRKWVIRLLTITKQIVISLFYIHHPVSTNSQIVAQGMQRFFNWRTRRSLHEQKATCLARFSLLEIVPSRACGTASDSGSVRHKDKTAWLTTVMPHNNDPGLSIPHVSRWIETRHCAL